MSWYHSLVQSLRGASQNTRPRPARPPLFLESLEDRMVPSSPQSFVAPQYDISVIDRGLARPTGITIDNHNDIFITQVPTPGVGGGQNSVTELIPTHGTLASATLHQGEPEPTNITVDGKGTIYWTCKSAGVILEQDAKGNTTKLLSGLQKPTGITVDPTGRFLYFTEIPTPGVSGKNGGTNKVSRLNLRSGEVTVLHTGDPEPTDIAADARGNVYWTCKSAGVIVERTREGDVSVILSGLHSPEGLALRRGKLYFTEVPTPGVKGDAGGMNTVNLFDLRTKTRVVIHSGDPEPTDITVDRRGDVYWTCSSAGVIVEAMLVDHH